MISGQKIKKDQKKNSMLAPIILNDNKKKAFANEMWKHFQKAHEINVATTDAKHYYTTMKENLIFCKLRIKRITIN